MCLLKESTFESCENTAVGAALFDQVCDVMNTCGMT